MTNPVVDPVVKIKSDLEAASVRFAAAHTGAVAAVTKARDVATKARRQGFHAIAKGVQLAVRRLEQAAKATTALDSDVKAARQRVEGVPRDANPAEVLGRLNPVTQQLTAVRSRTVGVYTTLTEAETAIKGALKGGQPGPLLGLVQVVRERLREGHQQTDAALKGTEAAIQEARRAGG